jgi:hypothetical protein
VAQRVATMLICKFAMVARSACLTAARPLRMAWRLPVIQCEDRRVPEREGGRAG